MTDAEKVERAMRGEYVGPVQTLAPLLVAQVERLKADRAALLDLWIVEDGRGWRIRFEAIPSLTYLTRAAAEATVLEWARGRKR